MVANRHFRRIALRERSRARVSRKPALSHVLFALTALAALVIQILVVQPHIHITKAIGGTRGVTFVAAAEDTPTGVAIGVVRAVENTTTPSRDKSPINEDPSNCPLCKEIVHSSHFLQSVTIPAVLLFDCAAGFSSLQRILPSFFAVSHIWHGRAPPKA